MEKKLVAPRGTCRFDKLLFKKKKDQTQGKQWKYGSKLLLEKAHVEGIRYYDVYRREGGYRSVEKALKMTPA